jgi:hypothetical protein
MFARLGPSQPAQDADVIVRAAAALALAGLAARSRSFPGGAGRPMARTGRHDDHQTRTSRPAPDPALPVSSRPSQGTTAGPHAAPAGQRRGRRYGARGAGAAVAVSALAALAAGAVAEPWPWPGHHLPRRAPDAVADAIAAFLAATEEPARRSSARWLTSAAGRLPAPDRSARVALVSVCAGSAGRRAGGRRTPPVRDAAT